MSISSNGRQAPAGKAALAVVSRPISSLILNPRNPRIHTRRQILQIARSIQSFGFNVPVLVYGNLQVIAGHGRVLACRELGWKEVPTICLEHLTETQAKAFLIADNRLTENAAWDETLLAEQIRELTELELDFSVEATGFTMGEIDLMIEGLTSPADGKPDPADSIPEPSGPAVSRPGDLWLLGRHRLYCGNSLEEEAFNALMQGTKAELVFIDPPYNVPIDGHATGLGAIRHREFAMASGEMSREEFTFFLTQAFRQLANHSINGSIHYVCMDWRHMEELLAAGRTIYAELKNLCVWVKDNGGMGAFYRSRHELVFVFRHGDAPHRNHFQLGQYGRYRTNVWEYAGANSFSRQSEEGSLLSLHPTVKPTAMVADAILDCTARGGIVLDSFLGSGTTLLAAERTGRICHGMEIDPLYVDTAIRRWQAMTGGTVRHAATGRSFGEMEASHD